MVVDGGVVATFDECTAAFLFCQFANFGKIYENDYVKEKPSKKLEKHTLADAHGREERRSLGLVMQLGRRRSIARAAADRRRLDQ